MSSGLGSRFQQARDNRALLVNRAFPVEMALPVDRALLDELTLPLARITTGDDGRLI